MQGAERALRCLLPSFPNRHAVQLRAQLQPTSLQRVCQKSPSKSGPDVESNPGAGKSEREGVKVSPDRERLVAYCSAVRPEKSDANWLENALVGEVD